MAQREANNVKAKPSKWLEQSLQDMEEKVNDTLKIINEDGDTFRQRAEMYYKKRPELVNFVEESFKAYRALSERYDFQTKELQSANRTIAKVFPEQVQFAMDDEEDEDDENSTQTSHIPEKPSGLAKATTTPSTRLSKTKVLEETDMCQNGERTVIEDTEAQSLMAATVLKSCQETLAKLQEKHAISAEDARAEYQKLKEAHDKLATIKDEIVSKYSDPPESNEKSETESLTSEMKDYEQNFSGAYQEHRDLNSNACLSVTELVDKIDALVDKVITIGSVVSSQNSLVRRLTCETNVLRSHMQNLEEDKDSLIEGSDTMSKRLRDLEKELRRVKSLNHNVKDQSNYLQTHFSTASCDLDNLSEKLQRAKLDTDVKEHKVKSPLVREITKMAGKKDISCCSDSEYEVEPENMISEDYTFVLQNYTEVQKKLSEMEKKNRDCLVEFAMQVKELKDANASREEQIQFLRRKLSPETNAVENWDRSSTVINYPHEGEPITPVTSSPWNNTSYSNSPAMNSSRGQNGSFKQRIFRSAAQQNTKISQSKEEQRDIKVDHIDERRHTVSSVEERIRAHIDELLEENLEFWLRFSASIHQVRKFQTSVKKLKSASAKTKDGYQSLREVQLNLTLWLQHNAVLKDELQSKFSPLRRIQEEILRVSYAEAELSRYQAAKFQGEILNVKQEICKMVVELGAGFDKVEDLKTEVESTLTTLDAELQPQLKSSASRRRIPLRTFLFGVKMKKQKHPI